VEELEDKVHEETSNDTEVSEQEASVQQESGNSNPVAPDIGWYSNIISKLSASICG
jgi:hypothetical protein